MQTLVYILVAHSLYMLFTAVWPLVHIPSFMRVTGYKTDIWLVKTVGVLLIAIILGIWICLWMEDLLPAIVLAISTAAGLTMIDLYYVAKKIISRIYLLDVLIELLFLAAIVWYGII